MDFIVNNSSFIVIIVLLGTIFLGCAFVIKRFWVDKRWFNDTNSFIGRHVYTQFQNQDSKESLEHVLFMTEDERVEEDQGEGGKKSE